MMMRRPTHHATRQAGFSLLEIVVVLAILTTLAGLAAPYFAVTVRVERTESTVLTMDSLAESLQSFGADFFEYPVSLDELLTNTEARSGWRGPYAVHRFSASGSSTSGDIRDDGWSEPFLYTRIDASSCRLRSSGEDRTMGSADDIVKDLNLTPALLAETRRRVDALNQAILAYNGDSLPLDPLPTTFAALRTRLIQRGYLADTSWSTADAWGEEFVLDPPGVSPPTRIQSSHGTGGGS